MNIQRQNGTFKTILVSVSASFVTLGLITNFLMATDKEISQKADLACVKAQEMEIRQTRVESKLDMIAEILKEIKTDMKRKTV